MRRHAISGLMLLLGLALLAGCGQKGPLSLPGTRPDVASPAAPAAAPSPQPAPAASVPPPAASGSTN
ncbi:MAG TPA: lipoprotein [Rhodanobacteraceae bacterium]|nr:lipoprotein [Rhodanobacteraceae bacterium]